MAKESKKCGLIPILNCWLVFGLLSPQFYSPQIFFFFFVGSFFIVGAWRRPPPPFSAAAVFSRRGGFSTKQFCLACASAFPFFFGQPSQPIFNGTFFLSLSIAVEIKHFESLGHLGKCCAQTSRH